MKLKILISLLFGFLIYVPTNSHSSSLDIDENIIVSQLDDDFEDFDDFNFDVRPKAEIYDPFEPVNRKIFIFNDYVDRYFFQYIAIFYRDTLPPSIRKSVRNFFNNLSAPFSVVNSLLQGNPKNAMASFSSFLINSTIGVAGLFNIAGGKDVRYYEEDFGQTFAKYGINTGPYLILPFFGPSNLRDATGLGLKSLVNPLSVNIAKVGDDELFEDWILISMTSLSLIDKRESLLKIIEDLRNNSFDLYATARSAYSQNRKSKVNNENKL